VGSDYLYTTPSFLAGVARLVDLFGELDDFNYAPSSAIADGIAARVDWQAVGGDLRSAMSRYRQEHEEARQLPLFEAHERESAAG
jgi:hypothetical protein